MTELKLALIWLLRKTHFIGAERYAQLRAYLIVEASPFFDRAWYLSHNGDVAQKHVDPVWHYLMYGGFEGRRPGPNFDSQKYLHENPEIRQERINPLVHYILYRENDKERTLTGTSLADKCKNSISDLELVRQSGLFDSAYYLTHNQDVKECGVDPLSHFMKYGWREGRNPSASFDMLYYVELNLQKFKGMRFVACNPLVHYLREGRRSGFKYCRAVFPRSLGIKDVLAYVKPADIRECKSISAINPGKIAIVVHLFYREMLQEFIGYFKNIQHPFDLFMTVLVDDVVNIRRLVAEQLPNCRTYEIIKCRNVGRDIGPFEVEIARRLLKYDLICKVHTKRDILGTGWRTLILNNLLGSPTVISTIWAQFKNNNKLGMVFPKAPINVQRAISLRGSWAGNYDIAYKFAAKAHLPDIGDKDTEFDFPAGSMFWARPAALGSLLTFDFKYEDFDVSIGRDGSLAHAIERLFGLIPQLLGYETQSILVSPPEPAMVPKPYTPLPDDELKRRVSDYLARRGKSNRVAVYTAVVGGYDKIAIPEELNPEIDYYYFSDRKLEGLSPWKWLPLDYSNGDATRITRYYKMHPFLYFWKYEHVMWIDANIMIRKDIVMGLVEQHRAAGHPISFMRHPERNCMYAEADVCLKTARDDRDVIEQQMKRYREAGVPAELGLPETGIYIVNIHDRRARGIFANWWHELDCGSKRDQLSIMYAMYCQGNTTYTPLFKNYDDSPRFSSKNFVYFLHKGKSTLNYPSVYRYPGFVHEDIHPTGSGAYVELFDNKSPDAARVVIVVPVHNAQSDVENCLASLVPTLPANAKVVIVNDGSDEPCATYLHDFVVKHDDVFSLIDHPVGKGYTISINEAARSVVADYYIFLNSDTIVSSGWIEKLLRAASSLPDVGIVGPLSNAASWQTVPVLWEGNAFCINALPPGFTIASINRECERIAMPGLYPKAQLINGFCYCVKASVFEKVGYFDEAIFPTGYGEEDDLSLRAVDAGFMLAFAPDTYVYHAKSKSFGKEKRNELVAANQKKFYAKHSRERVHRECRRLEFLPMMANMRDELTKFFDKGEK